jgi:hypothetical protein
MMMRCRCRLRLVGAVLRLLVGEQWWLQWEGLGMSGNRWLELQEMVWGEVDVVHWMDVVRYGEILGGGGIGRGVGGLGGGGIWRRD